MGWEGAAMSILLEGEWLQRRGRVSYSLENQFSDHVSQFVVPSSVNVSGRLANERIPLTEALTVRGCISSGGGERVMWP